MAKKMIGWHVVELLVAAVLLWYDTRFFLFYAFMNLLKVSHQVNHLRASVRVATLGHDSKLFAVSEHLGLTKEDVSRVERETLALDRRLKKEIDEDWRNGR